MKLIVGLGNPGTQYETTRHNIGFLAADQIIDEWNANIHKNQFDAETYETQRIKEKIMIVKPQTFMNLSGKSVAAIFKFYKCNPEDLIVIYDDVDLAFSATRIKVGGGSAGHNGIRSIDESLGKENLNYYKLRLGVGKSPRIDVGDYVLQNFKDHELKELGPVFDKTLKALEYLIQGKTKEAMNEFNRKPKEKEAN